MEKRTKRFRVLIGLVALFMILPGFIFAAIKLSEHPKVDLGDLMGYNHKLSYITKHYADDYDSRIIVKSERKIEDKNCIASASGFAGLNVLQYGSKEEAEKARDYFSKCSYVDYALVDFVVTASDVLGSDEASGDIESMEHLSWGAELLGVDGYQNMVMKKYGELPLPEVYVAVIDTGIDTDNEFLRGRIAYDLGISYYDSELYKSEKSSYQFEDDNSHGTHVSGTIVDLTLDNAKIIPVKVLDSEGSGLFSYVVSGMEYVVSLKQSGKNIVAYNMSLGGHGVSEEETNAIDHAYANNIMPVVAAGNDNFYVEESCPANIEKALTISALSQNDKYSNFPYFAYYSNFGKCVDLCLPGTEIFSCVPDECTYDNIYTSSTGGKYAAISGTSMATPHATALVALYATYYGEEYSVETVEREIKENTYDFGNVGKDDEYGYGVPTMAFALEEDAELSEPELSVGQLGSAYNFDGGSLSVTINVPEIAGSYDLEIYYSLDGSVPTLLSHTKYIDAIYLEDSAFLRFMVYAFDDDGNVHGHSQIYEVEYYSGGSDKNDTGVGFEIDESGVLTKYTSGLKDIVIPEYVGGTKVTALGSNLFYGLSIESIVCNQDIVVQDYPFYCCGSLTKIELHSSNAQNVAEYCFGLKELSLSNVSTLEGAFVGSSFMFGCYGSDTFKGCFNLEVIHAPKVKEILEGTFSWFKKLKTIDIDWENLQTLDENAFDGCESFKQNIVLGENLKYIGSRAFDGSGITGVVGVGVEIVDSYAFSDCSGLQYVELPSIKTIFDDAFFSSKSLEYVLLSDGEIQLYSDSLFFGSGANPTIYCYNKPYVEGILSSKDVSVVDLHPSINVLQDSEVKASLSGYGVSYGIYASVNDILDASDTLLFEGYFDRLCLAEEISYAKFLEGNFFYIIKATDAFGNTVTESKQISSTSKSYLVTVSSNIENHGLVVNPRSYLAGEQVSLTLKDVVGYTLLSIKIMGVDRTSEFVDGSYSFGMPESDVEIVLNYEKTKYQIHVSVSGEGEVFVKDSGQSQISEAVYLEQVYVNSVAHENCSLVELYYTDEHGTKTNLNIESGVAIFSMPASSIIIYAKFKILEISDFFVLTDRLTKTYQIRSYSGNEEYIKIPEYYNKDGEVFKFAGVGGFCFYQNQTVKSLVVEFIDDKTENISVGSDAFYNCSNLSELKIGTISNVESMAFYGCGSLLQIDLSNCKTIEDFALYDCAGLTHVDLTACTTLGHYAFANCSKLKSVVLGDGLKEVPQAAFQKCNNLQTINLENVQTIGTSAFYNCKRLESIDLSECALFDQEGKQFYNCSSLFEVTNPTKLKVLPESCFYGCSIAEFDFSGCEVIGERAFYGCQFEKIDLSHVISVHEFAFSSCSILYTCVLGANESLISTFKLNGYIRYIYISKDYSGEISSYIKSNFVYIYSGDGDYTVYSRYSLLSVTFRFANGTVVSEKSCISGDKVTVPEEFSDETYHYRFTSWKKQGTGDIVAPGQMITIYSSCTYIVESYSTSFVEYTVNFYYGYDFDESGVVGDAGDIFKSLTGLHYNQTIEFPTPSPTKPSDNRYTYAFRAWQLDGEDVTSSKTVNGNLDFVADYSASLRSYSVSWYNGDGELIYSESVEFGTLPSFDSERYNLPTKVSENERAEYFVFAGWSPTISAVTENAEYHPIFETRQVEYEVVYYYGYDFDGSSETGDDGDIFLTQTYHYDDLIEEAVCTHKYRDSENEYTFRAWDRDLSGKTVMELFELFEGKKLKVNALYDSESFIYEIRWIDGDGNLIYSENLAYGTLLKYNYEKGGFPTKTSTEQFKYEFIGFENFFDGKTVVGDESIFAAFTAYNVVRLSDNMRVADVSQTPNPNEALIDIEDIYQSINFEVRFLGVTLNFDVPSVKGLLREEANSVYLSAKTEEKVTGHGTEIHVTLLVKVDGKEIRQTGGKITVTLKCKTDDKSWVWKSNGEEADLTTIGEDYVVFKTNAVGEYVYGQGDRGDTENIVFAVCGGVVGALAIVAVTVVVLKRKKRRVKKA